MISAICAQNSNILNSVKLNPVYGHVNFSVSDLMVGMCAICTQNSNILNSAKLNPG